VGVKNIHLHIDQLVLRGFRPEDRHGFAIGLQRELARMLSDTQTATQLAKRGDLSRLSLGRLTIRHGDTPQQLGAHVARRIGRGTNR
jgi:phage head maturation protease